METHPFISSRFILEVYPNKKGKKINVPNKCSIATITSDDMLCRSCLNTPSTLHNNVAHITAADGNTQVVIPRISFFLKPITVGILGLPRCI